VLGRRASDAGFAASPASEFAKMNPAESPAAARARGGARAPVCRAIRRRTRVVVLAAKLPLACRAPARSRACAARERRRATGPASRQFWSAACRPPHNAHAHGRARPSRAFSCGLSCQERTRTTCRSLGARRCRRMCGDCRNPTSGASCCQEEIPIIGSRTPWQLQLSRYPVWVLQPTI
jgi:hypothetical protein